MEIKKDPIPTIGDKHSFFDDGKPYPSRHYIAEVVKIVTLEEAKNIEIEFYDDFFEDCLYRFEDKVESLFDNFKPTLYNIWKASFLWDDDFFVEDTEVLVGCSIPEYDENIIWFARTSDGGWFSLNCENTWQSGRLKEKDFDYKKLFESYKN